MIMKLGESRDIEWENILLCCLTTDGISPVRTDTGMRIQRNKSFPPSEESINPFTSPLNARARNCQVQAVTCMTKGSTLTTYLKKKKKAFNCTTDYNKISVMENLKSSGHLAGSDFLHP